MDELRTFSSNGLRISRKILKMSSSNVKTVLGKSGYNKSFRELRNNVISSPISKDFTKMIVGLKFQTEIKLLCFMSSKLSFLS